jgi:hypothetical protein
MKKTTTIKTPKTEVKAPKIKATQAPAKTAVAIKADVAEPTVLAAGGLPSSEFQSNIRTAVHPGKTKTAKAEKRIILNPQYVLNAKAAELKERGVKLTWASRAWHAGDRTFTSLEMSKYSVDEFVALFPAK